MHMYLFCFINWDGWRCWWTDFVPKAIHNPVASGVGSFDLTCILCVSVFTS